MAQQLSGIKTNIVTGFLGAGKSTAILHLLRNKPPSERWAILVNEFGEVGIDGGLLESTDAENVFIREVPGGCMCCTGNLPMQMAMNMLLARSRPDRLIIEPTGLGHPKEVMASLATDYYDDLLDVRATITLVDARKINEERYVNHAIFNEQLEIADIIVASKSDLYSNQDLLNLKRYLKQKQWLANKDVHPVYDGKLSADWLEFQALHRQDPVHLHEGHEGHEGHEETASEYSDNGLPAFPPEGYVRLSGNGEGYFSHGWIFEPAFRFERETIDKVLYSVPVTRMKALIRTTDGARIYNYAGDRVENQRLHDTQDSRIELITTKEFPVAEFEQALLAAAVKA